MNASKLTDIVLSLLVIALVTTLILPGRQTPQVIGATSRGLAQNIRAAMGR